MSEDGSHGGRMGPKTVRPGLGDGSREKTGEMGRTAREDRHRVTWPQDRPGRQQQQKLGEWMDQDLPRIPKGTSPADTSILDFWPPELPENKLALC